MKKYFTIMLGILVVLTLVQIACFGWEPALATYLGAFIGMVVIGFVISIVSVIINLLDKFF